MRQASEMPLDGTQERRQAASDTLKESAAGKVSSGAKEKQTTGD
jgi:hypothetical protein